MFRCLEIDAYWMSSCLNQRHLTTNVIHQIPVNKTHKLCPIMFSFVHKMQTHSKLATDDNTHMMHTYVLLESSYFCL